MSDDNKIQTPDYDPENPRCDREQLKFLKECIAKGPEGIKKWNQWRKDEKPEIWLQKADLSKAYLEGASLTKAHLEGANLREAHLEGAYLIKAHLESAIFERAHLEGADLLISRLEGAYLSGTHLEGASLSGNHLEGASLVAAHLEGAKLNSAHLDSADLREAHLEGANLWEAHLQDTDLWGANLEGAKLKEAHIEGADLWETHLEGASLENAYLSRANISDTYLQGTNCRKAIVDGSTLIWGCKINKRSVREKNYTDFAGVGLDSARIQPQIKQLLQYNIRKSNWSLWYIRLWNRNLFTKIISSPLVPIKWILVRPFWFISDYGRSTLRILITFLMLALAYATVYYHYPSCVNIYEKIVPFNSFLHAIYFSVVTMTTLGFGDIAANPKSTLGLLLLMSQVIQGYVLLGALVTRFAVLFTAGGPAGRFTPIHPKAKLLIKIIADIRDSLIAEKDIKKRIQLWCQLSQEISDGKYEHDEK